MSALSALACVTSLAFPSGLQAPETRRTEAGELFRNRCLACHVAPDPRFEVERAWIAQVAATACGDVPADLRADLVAYLGASPLPLPQVVDNAQPAAAGEATVLPSFQRGAVLLRASDGRELRLSWDEPGGERRRALPAGRYGILGYRLSAVADGASWHLVGSGLGNVTVGFSAGGTHVIAIDPVVRVEERIGADRIEVGLVGHEDAGVSLYRDGARVPLRYRRFDRAGALLGEGMLQFGRQGKAAAVFEPVEGARAAELVLESMPFKVRRVRM